MLLYFVSSPGTMCDTEEGDVGQSGGDLGEEIDDSCVPPAVPSAFRI